MRNGDKTKETISRVALKLFVSKGIKETTIKDIAAKAQVSEGAMYRHYSNKDTLAKELFESNYVLYAERLEALCEENSDLKGKIEAMVTYFCKEFDRDKVLFSYLLLSRHAELKKLPKSNKSPVLVIRKQIEEAILKKELSNVMPEVATAMVLGVVLETAQFIVYGRIKDKMSNLSVSLTEACWKILGI